MIEHLFDLIKQEGQREIIENPRIPNEQNNEAVGLATESVFNGLQGALANGGLKNVLDIFSGNGKVGVDNPVIGGIADNFIKDLVKKFGLNSPVASSIASSLIPVVLNKLVRKTNDPNDHSFNINSVIGGLLGAAPIVKNEQSADNTSSGASRQVIDFGNIIKNITNKGLDSNNDGQLGLDDLSGLVQNAAVGAQQQGHGGIVEILKGLVGK